MSHQKPVWDDTQILANIIRLGAWVPNGPIAYAFIDQPPPYGQFTPPGFAPFTGAQRTAVRDAMMYIADVAGLSFVEVPDNRVEPGSGNRRITYFGVSVQQEFSGSARNYNDGGSPAQIFGSEIVLNNWFIAQKTGYALGQWGRFVALHETLHALGLSHLGSYNGPGYNYHDHADFVQDTRQYSVMSYWDASEAGGDHTIGSTLYMSSTPLLFDVMALQHLYGANMSTRIEDTVYGFNSTAGRAAFDLVLNPHPVFTIWDAGGTDTLDLSGYASASRISLASGSFSDAGELTRNISIAHGATIENAVGGAGNDTIVGNQAANRLTGGGGYDVLHGLGGSDTFVLAALGESRVLALTGDGMKVRPDVLADFVSGEDRIDLSAIDAIVGTVANDAFSFVGESAFSGQAGELRWQLVGGVAHLMGDVDGDGRADLHIATSALTILVSDVVF